MDGTIDCPDEVLEWARGVDVLARGETGETPLHHAAFSPYATPTKLILLRWTETLKKT